MKQRFFGFTKEMMNECCSVFDAGNIKEKNFEVVQIEKTDKTCTMCEDFANNKILKKTPIAVISCEGACLRGEVSRQAANILCHKLLPESTARICLGAAFTKDGGQRDLVRNAQKVLALEGCFIECGSRIMKGVIKDFNPEIILVDKLYDFDKNIYGANEVTEQQIKDYSLEAANNILKKITSKS